MILKCDSDGDYSPDPASLACQSKTVNAVRRNYQAGEDGSLKMLLFWRRMDL